MCSATSRMRIESRCARWLCWMAPAGLLFAVTTGYAQAPATGDPPDRSFVESPDASAANAKAAAVNGPALAGPSLLDIRYLKGPDGRPVYVPDKVSLADFLKWVEQQQVAVP